jgi:hypothetical protein
MVLFTYETIPILVKVTKDTIYEPIYVLQHRVVSLHLVTYNYRHLLYVLIIHLNSSQR